MIRGSTLDQAFAYELIQLPDGTVFSMSTLKLAGRFEDYLPNDTLRYNVVTGTLSRHVAVSPFQLLTAVPDYSKLIEPPPFEGINRIKDIAIYDGPTSFFYTSFPSYAFGADELDVAGALIYVGDVFPMYTALQPGVSPIQPDTNGNGIPDNLEEVPDLNLDSVVNSLDLGILMSRWGSNDRATDFNNDGIVNVLDLEYLLAAMK